MADRRTEELRTFAHLAGVLEADFPTEVLNRAVRVVVGEGVLDTDAGQALVLTVARLLPRICHRVDFVSPTAPSIARLVPLLGEECFSSSGLATLARLIWPDGSFSGGTDKTVDLTLGIGVRGDLSLGVDAQGAAVVDHDSLAPVARGDAVFAALSSAALGCAVTAKMLYPEILGAADLEQVLLDRGGLGGALDAGRPPELARPMLAGVGAIGCAVVYAFIVVGATGTLLLIDPDKVSDTNLMRYILFDGRHLGLKKTAAAKQLVRESGIDLTIETEETVLQQHLDRLPAERDRMQLVLCAVDTYEARREIAGELPREVLNAGTSPSDFSISRHGFADGFACLACLYPVQKTDVEAEAVMARELGLDKATVHELRRTKAPLTSELLERVASSRGESLSAYAPYLGEPIDSFYNKVVCATTPVTTPRGEAVAPLGYGSALAGFLLAQAASSRAEESGVRRFRMDVIRGLRTPQRSSPRPRPACPYCGRAPFKAAYAARWH